MNHPAWQLLGLRPGASPREIQRAFRQRVRTSHPDQGGDSQQFQELLAARNQLLHTTTGNSVIPVEISLAEHCTGTQRWIRSWGQTDIWIAIPPGYHTGDCLKYGDIRVGIQVKLAENQRLSQGQLWIQQPVPVWTLWLGGEIELPLNQLRLVIPAQTPPDQQFVLPAQGGFCRRTQTRGDLVVQLVLTYPPLTPEQKTIIQSWQR